MTIKPPGFRATSSWVCCATCRHPENDGMGWVCREYARYAIGAHTVQWVCDGWKETRGKTKSYYRPGPLTVAPPPEDAAPNTAGLEESPPGSQPVGSD